MKNLYFLVAIICLAGLLSSDAVAQQFTDSNLPIVIISTDENLTTGEPSVIVDEPRITADMKIVWHIDGSRNFLSDQYVNGFLNYDGRISIEVRGSSSQELPKKSYSITTLLADGQTKNNVSLLAMPAENDWVLNGLAFDPSLIRDYLSLNLSRQIGQYAPRTAFCEVVINGGYSGLYLLEEKIKPDKNRVNIVKVLPEDDVFPNISGGYITKSDGTLSDPVAWTMDSYWGIVDFVHDWPKPELVTENQGNYIRSCFEELAVLSHAGNASPANGFPSIIDIPSFIDFMIINELASNVDAYQFSTFFNKDMNGKLRAGPVWDHNLTYGNDLFFEGLDRSKTNIWQFDNDDNEGAEFWKDLFGNPAFKCHMAKRWTDFSALGMPLNFLNISNLIDEAVTLIGEASVRENEKWATVPDLSGEISNIKSWVGQRMLWMTSHLGSYSGCSNISVPQLTITKINYHPEVSAAFQSADLEFIEIKNIGAQPADLTGIYFSEPGLSYRFPIGSSLAPAQSLFLASNAVGFQSKYGFPAFGEFTRNLSNRGQKLVLADAFGNVIDIVEYSDSAPWPDADGNGYFLSLVDESLDNNLATSWTVSAELSLSLEENRARLVSAFPNPVKDFLTVLSTDQISNIGIFDLNGRKFLETDSAHGIDLRKLESGIYILKIDFENSQKTIKIIKE